MNILHRNTVRWAIALTMLPISDRINGRGQTAARSFSLSRFWQ